MDRKQLSQNYLFSLVLRYETLEKERQQLLAAAARISVIQAEKADLVADAQDALTKYNALHGTSYTLTQVRAWYDKTIGTMSKPPELITVPNVVGLAQVDAEAAITALGLAPSSTTEPNETVAVGLVCGQSPVADTGVTLNSPVLLAISSGPAV